MARWIEPPPLELQLWYGNMLVADLHRVFPHQGTWFGEYHLRIASGAGEESDQVLAFIAFCEDFHRRIANGRDHDSDEFDRFAPLSSCDSWSARLPNGISVPMEGRVCFLDGQASWQHPKTEPSRELAANEFWARHAWSTW